MQIHRLIAFFSSTVFRKTRTPAFDLYFTPGFLLDVLNIGAALPYNLSPKIKTGNWF
jgi:hypothetical protein